MKTLRMLILGVLLVNFLSVSAQTPDEVLRKSFPELYGELKVDKNTQFDKNLVPKLREEYYKLENAWKEVETFKAIEGDREMPLQYFEFKDLKVLRKAEQLDTFMTMIKQQQKNISDYMYGKVKYGADSLKCIENIVLLNQYWKQKDLESAYHPWNILFHEYPIATKNIYTRGVNIVKHKMKIAETRAEQELWIDTLMLIYDQRLKFYGNDKKRGKGYILGRKGMDMYKYRKTKLDTAYMLLNQSVEIKKEKTEPSIFVYAMKATIDMAKQGKIDTAKVVDNYMKYSDLLAKQVAETNELLNNPRVTEKSKKKLQKKLEIINKIITNVDATFSSSDYAKCEALVAAFEPRFNENKTDTALIEKIVKILDKKKCTDSKLYEDATITLYELDPSELAAYNIAKLFVKKNKLQQAAEYYDKAIEQCTVDTVKAVYYYEAAIIANKLGKVADARSKAYKAIELKPNYGLPYILVASIIASANCGQDDFERATVYWLAVDKLIKAKQVDPSVSEQADKMIAQYRKRFPGKEDAFMHQVTTEGQSYKIGCWIQETTTARFRK